MPTWRELIAASGLPRLEAQVLTCAAAGVKRSWLLAHDTDAVTDERASAIRALFARRVAGEPVAYILGVREFFGLDFTVTPDVLIPRPETELLVELARAHLPSNGCLLDVGTGSGAVAVAIAHLRPDARVSACDVSPKALAIAADNARHNGVQVEFLESNLLAAFGGRRFHVIASNPPYVAAGDPHLSEGDLRFEPKVALEAGQEGMEVIARLAEASREHLTPGGVLVFEHGHDQGPASVKLLRRLGFQEVNDYNDLASISRVTLGRWPG